MGQAMDTIDRGLREFIEAQRVFFVATAPLKADGLINLSPKGLGTFCVLDERTAAYLDLTGSGIETAAHLKENGRMVVMFCAFEGPPKIVRLHGRGEYLEAGTAEFAVVAGRFQARPGMRGAVVVHVSRVSVSCGHGVPLMEYRGDRKLIEEWAAKKGEEGMREYREKKNRVSVEGMRGLGSMPLEGRATTT